jgi:isopentenyl diphosphate isomerase/L-lactate dehydrogenase-like FMN-dependent dehydrogenase
VSAGRAEGEAGAPRALEILCDEVRRTMHLYGARSIDELTPDLLA